MLLHLHHADWLYSPITDGRMGLYLQGLCLPVTSSRQCLSCLLHLLIDSAIVLAGMAADSDSLGSRKAPTGDGSRAVFTFYTWCERNHLILLFDWEKIALLILLLLDNDKNTLTIDKNFAIS